MDSSTERLGMAPTSAAAGPMRASRVDARGDNPAPALPGHAVGAARAETQDELWKLRACVSDLVSLLALPSLWRDGDATLVTGVLADVLLRMLKLDFVYARLGGTSGAPPTELLRRAGEVLPGSAERPAAAAVGRALAPWLNADTPSFGAEIPSPLGGGDTAIAFLWLGADADSGVLVAGSRRDGFPSYPETVLLRVAVNQAVVELQRQDVLQQRRQAVEQARTIERLRAENDWQRRGRDRLGPAAQLIGHSPALQRVRAQVEHLATGHGTVLIHGDVGTGKTLVARCIHQLSARREQPFVVVDCAAAPATQLELDIFGRAVESGAGSRPGAIELAEGGTLLLRGLTALPAGLQERLLRLLEDQEYVPLGGNHPLRADVRLMAACRDDLASRVAGGQFDVELFERLRRHTVALPPLRDRAEDIPALALHFMEQHARRHHKPLSSVPPEVLEVLCSHAWPANVHELDNLIERAVLLSSGPALQLAMDLGGVLSASAGEAESLVSLDQAQREHILRALAASNWVIAGPSGAAAKLGMKRTSLQYRMQKLGISRPA